MDVAVELHMVLQVLLAFLLAGIIGWEREKHGRQAGIRTFAGIGIGACVFGLISIHGPIALGFTNVDVTRVAANVVVGVGFLGAGIIFQREGGVAGLTTAASLWATAAVGVAVAFRMYTIAILVTVILLSMLWLPGLPWWKLISGKRGKEGNNVGS
jgi:putative Mg2+ transporter-C (MgtC) family protein